MEALIQSLADLDPIWVYTAIFAIAYLENILPPLPSDVIVVFGGSMVAIGKGHALIALMAATAGSTLGFLTMYGIGAWFGRRILETGRLRFISLDTLHKAEAWFGRYGYWLIVLNRFLAGTRAIVAFFAGISTLDFKKTLVLSAISALVWNSILIYSGYALGRNWEKVGLYLSTYSQVVTALLLLVVIVLVVRWLSKRKNGGAKTNG